MFEIKEDIDFEQIKKEAKEVERMVKFLEASFYTFNDQLIFLTSQIKEGGIDCIMLYEYLKYFEKKGEEAFKSRMEENPDAYLDFKIQLVKRIMLKISANYISKIERLNRLNSVLGVERMEPNKEIENYSIPRGPDF